MDRSPTETIVEAFSNMVGSASWRMNLDMFLQALDAPDDDYWRDKFTQFREMAEAVGRFDSGTISKIILFNEEHNLKRSAQK
jgi:hypothetical protein